VTKRNRLLPVLVIFGLCLFLFSFTGREANAETDIGIVGLEVGSCFIFNIDVEDFAPAQYFSINLGVSEGMIAGFTSIRGDGTIALNYDLFKLSYFISKSKPIGLDILVGGCGGNVTAGVNMFFNIFQNQIADMLSTILKFKVGYLLTETTNPTGSAIIALTGQIGF